MMTDETASPSYVVRRTAAALAPYEVEDLRTCKRLAFATIEEVCEFFLRIWPSPAGTGEGSPEGWADAPAPQGATGARKR